jgi:hypothetical protein
MGLIKPKMQHLTPVRVSHNPSQPLACGGHVSALAMGLREGVPLLAPPSDTRHIWPYRPAIETINKPMRSTSSSTGAPRNPQTGPGIAAGDWITR